jgi:hypothetical protein
MIDTSAGLGRYARYLIGCKRSLPYLKNMMAWCDHRPSHLYSNTMDLREYHMEPNKEYRTEGQIVDAKREVETQLSKIRMEIDCRPGRTRNWREF